MKTYMGFVFIKKLLKTIHYNVQMIVKLVGIFSNFLFKFLFDPFSDTICNIMVITSANIYMKISVSANLF